MDAADTTRMERERILSAVEGFADLGLMDMAHEELATLSEADRHRPEVHELHLCLLIRERRWDDAIAMGLPLCTPRAERPAVYIHTAYALHEARRTAEARELLSTGPPTLRDDPLYHYNMACYMAVLGDLRAAGPLLRQALEMDQKLRRHALTDPDLKDLRSIL